MAAATVATLDPSELQTFLSEVEKANAMNAKLLMGQEVKWKLTLGA